MQKNDVKIDAINSAKIMLAEIPFSTIYSYADVLFDLPELLFNDSMINQQIDFLKNSKLKDLDFLNTDDPHFFTLQNNITQDSIQVSNRQPTRGELRAEKLRHLIMIQEEKDPEEYVYHTITTAIRTANYSDMVTMLKASVSTGENTKEMYNSPMDENHFDLFVSILLAKIELKIKNHTLRSDFEPKDIRNSNELQELIWSGIDVNLIYDASQLITNTLCIIQSKAIDLEKRGYHKANECTLDLYQALLFEKDRFVQNQISISELCENYKKIMENASHGELNKYRGFFGIVWHNIQIAIHYLTFGATIISPTQSILKTLAIKNEVTNFISKRDNDSISSNPELRP